MSDQALARAAGLPCWSGPVTPQPLRGGITNTSFLVRDRGEAFVVRIGSDIPVHGFMRFNELAASRAAFAAGLSPEVVFAAEGVMVLRYIDGCTLTPDMVREPKMLGRIIKLIKRCHTDVPRYLRGPVLAFWVFHVVRDYAASLIEAQSPRAGLLPRLLTCAERLERAVGPIDLVFGHNDLLAANLIDDGARLWLIDWDYAGFNSPLFDLGGLASNNELPPEQERDMLARYFGDVGRELERRYAAMRCASLLREAMWSMVSECHSTLAFDYASYTDVNLARFDRAYAAFEAQA